MDISSGFGIKHILKFYKGPRATQCRAILNEVVVWGRCKKCRLWWYIGNITLDPRHEDIKIVEIREASFQKSVIECTSSGEESEWDFLLTNCIRREWERVYSGNMIWLRMDLLTFILNFHNLKKLI